MDSIRISGLMEQIESFVNLLKITFNESFDHGRNNQSEPEVMRVLPVNFGTEHKQMLVAFGNDNK